MKALRKKIREKLNNYEIKLNQPNTSLPFKIAKPKKVAVIGGGIAGIAAACNLAERGLDVHLFEKNAFLGGKIGSWQFKSNGEMLRAEHGFHAFFRQYYNLREFLKKLGADKHLIPIDDYVILFGEKQKQGFKNLDNTPGLNILDLRKHGVFNYLTFINPLSIPFLHLLQFDFEKTYKKFDSESFASFAKRTMMPKKMRIVFNSFARAFFAEPEDMSMAELIKSFHFYFLSNEDGLLYDVLDDDFQYTFISYCEDFLNNHQTKIWYNTPIHELEKTESGYIIHGNHFDYCIIASDVKHTKRLFEKSKGLDAWNISVSKFTSLKTSGRYAVWRLWTDAFEHDDSLPFFIFTDRLKCLDSITLYHKMEKTSAEWSFKNHGGIFELHSYAVPKNMVKDEEIKEAMLYELFHYMPELKGMKIKHEFFQHRDDFPAFHTNQFKNRPEINTGIPGLYAAGDWVKMDNCTMLMEAAYTSGALAANYILREEGLQENPLRSVPTKGLLT